MLSASKINFCLNLKTPYSNTCQIQKNISWSRILYVRLENTDIKGNSKNVESPPECTKSTKKPSSLYHKMRQNFNLIFCILYMSYILNFFYKYEIGNFQSRTHGFSPRKIDHFYNFSQIKRMKKGRKKNKFTRYKKNSGSGIYMYIHLCMRVSIRARTHLRAQLHPLTRNKWYWGKAREEIWIFAYSITVSRLSVCATTYGERQKLNWCIVAHLFERSFRAQLTASRESRQSTTVLPLFFEFPLSSDRTRTFSTYSEENIFKKKHKAVKFEISRF